ncbi:MAG: SAP domain-containing protein [Pyrinomonadaceae bacterium]
MTVKEFDHGYWYALELKEFAHSIGVPSSGKLRKDELEAAIKHFLKTGRMAPPPKRKLSVTGRKDVELGLSLLRRVVVYTNDKATKDFLDREARKRAPGMKRRSGARYRLNRYREKQLAKGAKLTYLDLVKEYVRLNQLTEPYAKAPTGRYINFLSDFLAAEKNATHAAARAAWAELKKLDIPKDYHSWVNRKSGATDSGSS